ncbi:bacillithiol biosynthesis cysteine-adding enzyme BshC [Poritiphilus flavus]|uniref:Putative cysteine ligase BshC n=1 Tax=Poritiphilus flavus TaxID=2697053 RepID=A0A6L9EB63_9FLAO|nr:bacillithiol biosynthesis cysteine-adding enzyme BshC [Poritiphilus flavus]NAS12005.1 bacillithiol biosynthesis cysteine-adding enzyme BshC [Poritiphilus flavus]
MEVDCISFRQTGYFSNLICDYLSEKENLKPFYHRFPNLEAFQKQIQEKQQTFPLENRSVLARVLEEQYAGMDISKKTKSNIALLRDELTFTVVTGHQLNLFTGPLYFLYKIVSTIKLTEALKKAYPQYHFVPVYWMATEDHDFEEINYFNFRGKKLQWSKDASGAVGKLDTEGLDQVLEAFTQILEPGKNSDSLKALFEQAYLENNDLSSATRYLANELFKPYGLVILDADDHRLKTLLTPYIKKDILENSSFTKVTEAIAELRELDGQYNIQVNPREINYFYLQDGLRERIVEKDGKYQVLNTELEFSREQLVETIDSRPERFSPNVITRPLYQEVILPNLCYIGGGGELAYWLELKSSFEALEIPFPILLLRNSAVLLSEKQGRKMEKLGLKASDLFLKQSSFINKKIREISNIEIDFSPQKQLLEEHFESLYELAEQTDPSFLGAVKAQEVKQKKGLDHLEKRLLKAQKRKLKDQVIRMTDLQNDLFPNQSLQERNQNFSELYLQLGDDLIPFLMKALDPLQLEFLIAKY